MARQNEVAGIGLQGQSQRFSLAGLRRVDDADGTARFLRGDGTMAALVFSEYLMPAADPGRAEWGAQAATCRIGEPWHLPLLDLMQAIGKVQVYLDGERVSDCYAFDVAAGQVWVSQHDGCGLVRKGAVRVEWQEQG